VVHWVRKHLAWLLVSTVVGAASISSASSQAYASRLNLLLICVDDLRPELNCYGRNYIHSPHIDRLAEQGRLFRRHYVQAPTCGASRYALLTGQYGPADNQALFSRARRMREQPQTVVPSMPAWFRQHGYTTVSVGKVSHHPGGRGGPDWNDDTLVEMPSAWDRHLMPVGPWRHPRGAMHGLAHGETRDDAGSMDVFQAAVGNDSIYPDGLIVAEAVRQLESLAEDDQSPFLLAVGLIRPHLPFGAPAKYYAKYRDRALPAIDSPDPPQGPTTWHRSGEFMKYNRWGRDPNRDAEFADLVRRHYAACVTYADAQVGRLLARLAECGATENTIVIVWGDHGWHLGEHGVWGKHTLFEESLRAPLIIRYPGIPDPGEPTDAIVESVDLLPTLCQLTNLPPPPQSDGRSLVPVCQHPNRDGRAAVSYFRRARTIRTNRYRLIEHDSGDIELYDHHSADGESVNIASDHPELAARLRDRLNNRLPNAK